MARRKYDLEDLAGQLYDLLVASPDGLDIYEIAGKLSIPRAVAVRVIRKLRLILGNGDSINVPWKASGRRRLYFLAGKITLGQQWQSARLDKKLSDLRVDLAWWRSMVEATDGRTVDGKKARLALRYQQRLFEDLEESKDQTAG